MAELDLQTRLDFLLASQNQDGAWGYFPGKQSWLEPTAYAMLALLHRPGTETALDHAWSQVLAWQSADGSWRPGTGVSDPTWVTALGVILACCRAGSEDSREKAIGWLTGVSGAESRWSVRMASYLHFLKTAVNVEHQGWAWIPGTSAWIEPTALTVLALRKSLVLRPDREAEARAIQGEDFIFSRRGRDGGWNSGNSSVLNYDVASYPETTALALIGLQGRARAETLDPLRTARSYFQGCKSSLARAWLTIAFRCYGQEIPVSNNDPGPQNDVLLCALQALGHASGNFPLLRPGALA